MLYAILINENNNYDAAFPCNFAVFVVKIPCTLSLHLKVFPAVA
jgi:hypothetical protein